MKINYELLYLGSIEVERILKEKGITELPIQGRFKEYQKEVYRLALAWKNKVKNKEDPKITFDGKQVLALKELREIVEILKPILSVFDKLPKNTQIIAKQKISTILSGPTYITDEKSNTLARNYQFELRLSAKLIEAGYDISLLENPDIAVDIKGRRYAIECKRITGTSSRTIQTNIESAIDQLILHKDNFYAGIVAIDVSALLDNRSDLLLSKNREAGITRILDDMEHMLFEDFKRNEKIKKYSHSHLVALFYNFSGSYVSENENEVGWAQGTDVLVFNGENPNKAKSFNSDFENFRIKGQSH